MAHIRKCLSRGRKPAAVAPARSGTGQPPARFAAEHEKANIDRIFTALFTVETVKRISPPHWRSSTEQMGEQEIGDDFERDFVRFGCDNGVSAAAYTWCLSILRMNLPWHIMACGGPWAGDARADMAAHMLESFERACRGNTESHRQTLHRCAALFADYLRDRRSDLPTNFLPRGIFLVEGATESILFPRIAACLDKSLESLGLMLIAAGGANQVAKRFLQLKEIVVLPIACVLDSDAVEQAKSIRQSLRQGDQLHVLQQGEVEDTFSSRFFTGLLNQYLHGSLATSALIECEEFDTLSRGQRKTETAQLLLRQRASLDFDKVQFAKLAAQQFKSESDIPDELRYIVGTIADGLSGATNGSE